MRKQKPTKPYWEMSVAELADATKEFDKPLPRSRSQPLSKSERERFERAQRSPYISIFVGDGNRLITVAIDDELLKQSDEYAKKHQLSRSELIERCLRRLLPRAG